MKSKFINANGIQFHYVEEGEGELVILLHGFPEFWYGWRNQIPVLSKNYRVVAPDMRGYNLSDKPQEISDYKIETLAKDIADLIVALGEEKAILIGHDWGAAVAWATATLYPERIKKLGIINVPHPAEMRRAFFTFNLKQWARSYYIFFFQLPAIPERFIGKDLNKFFTNIFTNMSPKGVAPSNEDLQKYVVAYSQPGAIKGAVNYYRAAMRNINNLKNNEQLIMPVMVLWGEQDKALGKELTYNTKQYCTNLQIHYDPTSGHFVQHDNPEWVNNHLLNFLKQ